MNKKPIDQKSLWKATLLEHLHNCFIGISNLTCTNSDCPLVYHWDTIEEKLSKKGKSALYQVSQKDNKFLVVDLLDNPTENDLGELENIQIQFKSGKIQRTPPKADQPISQPVQISGYQVKQEIKWDQDKSKKKVFCHVENDPSEQTQATQIDASNKDYLFYISDPSITNQVKKFEIYSPGTGNQERQQLWTDYKEELSELKEFFGIRHNTQEKEDRQNNPEISLLQSPFLATERRKKRIREESLREAETKQFCPGIHTLSYGSLQEHQQEIMLAEQVENHPAEEVKKENQAQEEIQQIPFIKEKN